jgi:hypothetical protein
VKEEYAFLQAGAHKQVLASFTRAEDLFGEAGDRRRQARACTNKALVLDHRGVLDIELARKSMRS